MTDDEIRSELGAVHTTREQLDLLNQCATRAGLNPVDHAPFNPLITALNAGAHGRAPAAATLAECRSWVAQARQLAHRVHALTG